jgi:hypothetical protein
MLRGIHQYLLIPSPEHHFSEARDTRPKVLKTEGLTNNQPAYPEEKEAAGSGRAVKMRALKV